MKANVTTAERVLPLTVLREMRGRLAQKRTDYLLLVKSRLSGLVLFTTGVGYWLASDGEIDGRHLLLVLVGALGVIGGANAFNEVMERNTDALMDRTANRPLPAGRMSVVEALLVAGLLALGGLGMLLAVANPLTASLAALALLSYVLVYTPLKQHTPLCVLVGAIPGAIPPLMGWAAARGDLGGGGWSLFLLQFLWQFPHFWSIAWLCRDDYARAGFRMLPLSDTRGDRTARQILLCSLLLIPVGWLPGLWWMGGWVYRLGVLVMGTWLILRSLGMWRDPSRERGRKTMLAVLLFLPVLLLLLLLGL